MFTHIFTYRLKCLFRDKDLMFWTLLFPLILATFFNMAFSNMNGDEVFHPIDIAVVDDAQYQQNTDFKTVLEQTSSGIDRTFNLTTATKENADKLLADSKITGYITVGKEIKLTVKDTGLNESIIQSFLDDYRQTYSAVASIIAANPTDDHSSLLSDVSNRLEYTKKVSSGSTNPDNTLNYFYSLIAMACLYGGFWGLKEVGDVQADLSVRAARVNLAPVHKLKTFLSSLCAALLLNYAEMLALLAYLHYVLKIDFGSKTGYVLLTAFVGCILGISLGALVGAVVKRSENIKTAILLAVTMTGSFLSGMMYENMKYIVAQKAPALAYLNPVNLLTDAFYALYYYDTYTRFALNLGVLGIFILVFCTATYLIIRRQKYASL